MDPLQWMGAVRMRVQTTDKNITKSNPHDSSASINVLWSEKLCVSKKEESSVNNIVFSSEKAILSNQDRNMQRSSTKPYFG